MGKSSSIAGTVASHNRSPKGHIEGFIVDTKRGRAQVNFDKHARSEAPALGSAVDLSVEHEDDGDHPVYRMAGAPEEVSGTVVALNYALHGEVNGYQLDSGVFVHTKPDGASKKIKVGSAITAKGKRQGPVLEAEKVTATSEGAKRAAKPTGSGSRTPPSPAARRRP